MLANSQYAHFANLESTLILANKLFAANMRRFCNATLVERRRAQASGTKRTGKYGYYVNGYNLQVILKCS